MTNTISPMVFAIRPRLPLEEIRYGPCRSTDCFLSRVIRAVYCYHHSVCLSVCHIGDLRLSGSLHRNNVVHHTIFLVFEPNFAVHILKSIDPESCPTNSLDLNPVDFSAWGALQQKLYR